MGLNTTVLILNDALGEIAKDQDFGKKLAAAVQTGQKNAHIGSGFHSSAATVIETHHADNTVVLAVGGNCASVLLVTHNKGIHHTDEARLELLREWAHKILAIKDTRND